MPFIGRSAVATIFFILLTSMTSQKPLKIIFFGDSITEAGIQPNGYITRIKEALTQKAIAAEYDLIGAGVSGNKVYDLFLRMDEDVLSKNPDVVVIWIGVNDVWHKASSGTGTDADKFEKFYIAIIKKLQAKKIRVIVCTPTTIGEKIDFTNEQDGDLNEYSQIIRNLAKNYDCSLIDLREIFHGYELKNNPSNRKSGILTLDGVHLNERGNELVADNMMDVLTLK